MATAPPHPALAVGRTAVITGGASGIGLAFARRCAAWGMNVVLADNHEVDLGLAQKALVEACGGDASRVLAVKVDVGDLASVQGLKAQVYEKFKEVGFLLNNAGIAAPGGPFDRVENWQRLLQVNLWGVINCVQTFTDAIVAQGTPALIVNTGSKQGITCPPGDTAYNVSKAGVKVLTEGLQHSLRNVPGCAVTAHLLVPGWVNTELVRKRMEHDSGGPVDADKVPFCESKPNAGAWMPDQVVDYFLEKLGAGAFYIICPDNEVAEETDRKRMLWSGQDAPLGRPALSRWHPDHKADFEAFMKQ